MRHWCGVVGPPEGKVRLPARLTEEELLNVRLAEERRPPHLSREPRHLPGQLPRPTGEGGHAAHLRVPRPGAAGVDPHRPSPRNCARGAAGEGWDWPWWLGVAWQSSKLVRITIESTEAEVLCTKLAALAEVRTCMRFVRWRGSGPRPPRDSSSTTGWMQT